MIFWHEKIKVTFAVRQALVLVLQYFFLLPIDHYFDDYWMFSAP